MAENRFYWLTTVSNEEKDQIIREEDDQGNILSYPAWNKKNALKDNQNSAISDDCP